MSTDKLSTKTFEPSRKLLQFDAFCRKHLHDITYISVGPFIVKESACKMAALKDV